MRVQVCYLYQISDKKVLVLEDGIPSFIELSDTNSLPIIFKNDITLDDINLKYGRNYSHDDYLFFYFELPNIKNFNFK